MSPSWNAISFLIGLLWTELWIFFEKFLRFFESEYQQVEVVRTGVRRFGWFSYMLYNFLRWFSWYSPFLTKMGYCSSAHLGRFFLTRCHRKIHNFPILNRVELKLGVHMKNIWPNMHTKFQADWLLQKKVKSIKLQVYVYFCNTVKTVFRLPYGYPLVICYQSMISGCFRGREIRWYSPFVEKMPLNSRNPQKWGCMYIFATQCRNNFTNLLFSIFYFCFNFSYL